MTYELAEELRNNGYPQPKNDEWEGRGTWMGIEDGNMSFAPTLSKLIEACQPYFESLICLPTIQRSDFWGNKGEIIQNGGWEAFARIDNIFATGLTPEEAVARLWLALQKNEKRPNMIGESP